MGREKYPGMGSRANTYSVELCKLSVNVGSKTILKDINLKLPQGQLIGILGPNGAGKTTLLRAITGFLPLTSGHIKVMGMDLEALSAKERARIMAHLPQNLETPFHFKVLDVVAMGRYAHNDREAEAREKAMKALSICQIAHLASRSFVNLSGGEKRLVLLARCLCQDSPFLLLDEATSSLDIRRKLEVFELLKDQVAEKRRTILIVIHDINLASLYLDRLLFIKQGKIIGNGPVKDVLNSDYLTQVFETKTIVMDHPECNRPAVLFSPRRNRSEAGIR